MTEKEVIEELIRRMKVRRTNVWKQPNPYIKPLYERSEIDSKVKQLEKLIK